MRKSTAKQSSPGQPLLATRGVGGLGSLVRVAHNAILPFSRLPMSKPLVADNARSIERKQSLLAFQSWELRHGSAAALRGMSAAGLPLASRRL